jgi:NADPH:quinone reductase-like Zn-dependent oxidoreductase
MMKAVLFDQHGGPEVLRFAEVATPAPRPGHVLVRVAAAGLNAYDLYLRGGHFPYELCFPHVLGADVVGNVVETGEGVPAERVGEQVIVAPGFPLDPHDYELRPENWASSYAVTGTLQWGGYAQFMEVPARWALPNETGLRPTELATLPLVVVTAVHAVKTLAAVGRGDRVLVQAGASGSGAMAIQVAKALGAQVITTVSTEAKAAVARDAGADEVVFYRREDIVERTLGWTGGEGVDAVVDSVGASTLGGSLNAARHHGRVVLLGFVGGDIGQIPITAFFYRQLQLLGSFMGSSEELRWGLDALRRGDLHPIPHAVFPLREAARAHQLLADHAVNGKLVLLPWED